MDLKLPFFKFNCVKWLVGKITFEDLDVQGTFANIMPFYWANNCKIELDTLKKKFKPEHIDRLVTAGIIKKKGTFAVIKFLDEEFKEASETSEKNSANGAKGAEKRWKKNKKGPAEVREGEHVIEPEKTVEIVADEKKRLEDFKKRFLGTIDAPESIVRNHKGVKLEQVPEYLDRFNNHLSASRVPFQFSDYRIHFNKWMFHCERIEASSGEKKNKLSYSLVKKKADQ